MKKLLMIIPLVILLCFTFGCQQGEEPVEEAVAEVGALSDEDVAAIKTTLDSLAQALLAGGTEAILEFFTEDTTVIAEGGISKGREELKEIFSKVTYTAFNQTLEEIDGRYDLAFVRGTASLTMEAEGAPEPIQGTGKFLDILRKQEDGSWLIAISMLVSDYPLPE